MKRKPFRLDFLLVLHMVCFLLITSFLFVGCSKRHKKEANQPVVHQTVCPPSAIFFEYRDFGPQAMAHELLGMEWYQWQPHGDSDPKSIDDIKVIVFNDMTLTKVQELYPVNPEKKHDYRYVHIDRARKFLQEKIAELGELEDDDTSFFELKERLKASLARLQP